MNKIAFLDRDGIINVDSGYVYKRDSFVFTPFIFQVCRSLQKKGFLLVVVTNQSGIGRGLFTLDDFTTLNNWMVQKFSDNGVTISKVLFCPHAPDEHCTCRKPSPKLFLEAISEFSSSPGLCLNIGDKPTDIVAGLNAGITQNFLLLNNNVHSVQNFPFTKQIHSLEDLL
jgi:D-glycero-D-manno-heptose 1,7-bisphosphate phosphatase